MMSPNRYSIREHFLFKAGLALDLLFWLLSLPALLHVHTIPSLLKHLTARKKQQARPVPNLNVAVGIVIRVCNLRVFHARLFPKTCLRQSLTLYRTLSRMGYPVQIHFGVINNENGFQAHSWVTVEGETVADTARSGIFKVVYSYSSCRQSRECRRLETERSKNEAISYKA
jgi:hypothetical protein